MGNVLYNTNNIDTSTYVEEIKELRKQNINNNIKFNLEKNKLLNENTNISKQYLEHNTKVYELEQKLKKLSEINKALRESKHIANDESRNCKLENIQLKTTIESLKKQIETLSQLQLKKTSDITIKDSIQNSTSEIDRLRNHHKIKVHNLKSSYRKKIEKLRKTINMLSEQKKQIIRVHKQKIEDYNLLSDEMTGILLNLAQENNDNQNKVELF